MEKRAHPYEFTSRALILGSILSMFFFLGNVYLGLRVGMTISASIPSAVLSMAILRVFCKSVSILENNIVQTCASVGEGLAAGIIFTIPALFILGEPLSSVKAFLLSICGSLLGILFMIPMRRYVIIKESSTLPFPEGRACANILRAGGAKMQNAFMAIWGITLGATYQIASSILGLWSNLVSYAGANISPLIFRLNTSPALLGVGYIIGPRIASITFSGAIMAWWVIIPLIQTYATGSKIIFPGKVAVSQMDQLAIWSNYVRYIGIGSVVVGGLYSLISVAPMISKTLAVGIMDILKGFGGESRDRKDRDIPMGWLIIGSIGIITFLWLLPTIQLNLFTIILVTVLGYFFTAVTSITVGLVGSSSNPASGMVITTLLISGLFFVALGWTERHYLITIITMSVVVNIAICLAGTTAQDLKTGHIVGATPMYQQIAEIIGLIVPSIIGGVVINTLAQAYTFGSIDLPAPQAVLVSVLAQGIISGELPIILVLIGVILGVMLLVLRIPVLPFSIGLYLPLEVSSAILVGGFIKYLYDRFSTTSHDEENGMLTASGLVAGDAVVGIIAALLTVAGVISTTHKTGPLIDEISLSAFFVIAILLFMSSLRKKAAN